MQPDPGGLDQGPNLYEYVGDEPVNRVDPPGLYTCGGDATKCNAIAGALDNDRKAAAALPKGSEGQKTLNSIIKFYGKKGDATTGVSFNFTKSGLTVENMTGTQIQISVNLEGFSKEFAGRSDGSKPSVELAAAIVHEGQQGIDDRARGQPSWRRSEVFKSERDGFKAQSFVNQGLNTPSAYNVWRPGILSSEQERALDSNARRATALDCSEGPCAPN